MHHCFKPFAAAAIAISLCIPLTASAEEQPDLSTVVATVNGIDITLGHIAVAKQTLPDQYRNLPAEVLFPGILDQLIQQSVLAQSYEGDWPQRIVLSIDNETRSLLAGEVVEKIMANAVTTDLLKKHYEEKYGGEYEEREYHASHILVETEEEALAVVEELSKGADFAATARERSTGPSGPRGGDLGWFGPGVMVPDFEAAVVAMEAGQVSDPVQTRFGWHVIKLNEARIKEAPSLDDVREELEQEIRTSTVTSEVEARTAAAKIDRDAGDAMDPKILDKIDLLQIED